MERRLAAILAADVVGYSQLMSADEEGTRRTNWFKPQKAANAVKEPELRAIIRSLNSLLA
jgi:hypothetical protein